MNIRSKIPMMKHGSRQQADDGTATSFTAVADGIRSVITTVNSNNSNVGLNH